MNISLKGCPKTTSFTVGSTNTTPSITSQPSTAPQSYCVNSSATALSVTATGTGLTYQWYSNTTSSTTGGTLLSGATSASYTPSTLVSGTLYYYCIVSGTCLPAVTSSVSGSITVGGIPSLLSGVASCNSFVANWNAYANATTYLIDVSINNLFSSFVLNSFDVGNVTSFTVGNLQNGVTYYYRIWAILPCGFAGPSLVQNITISSATTVTWNGTSWSPNPPSTTASDNIIISSVTPNSPFTTDVSGCTLTINTGVIAIVSTGVTLTIANAVTTNGELIFENNASLYQTNPLAVNTGAIEYRRISADMENFDYTYWSSPVKGQTAKNLSPNTLADKYYRFIGTTGWFFDDGEMKPSVGFIIRVPKPGSPNPDNWSGTTYAQRVAFKGVPNNGLYSFPVKADEFNLVGNPYPSALDAKKFMEGNSGIIYGALYFWTHNTPINGGAYTSDDYATYNITGGTATGPATGAAPSLPIGAIPSGNIAAGQSFFVGTKTVIPVNSAFMFTNAMRVAGNNTQFFKQANTKKTASAEKNRIWLNLTNSKGTFKQLLVGYVEGATNDWDNLYDGPSFDGQTFIDFYSVNQGKNLTIQGRALPFEVTDVVPLGYRIHFTKKEEFIPLIAGSFEISIDSRDGQLASQEIWLEDKKNNTLHDLTKGSYTFSTIKTTTQEDIIENDRFVLHYANKTLATEDSKWKDKTLVISIKNKKITLTSSEENIFQVQIYDILGRKIYDASQIDAKEWAITSLKSSDQVLIVKTTLTNGASNSEKIVF